MLQRKDANLSIKLEVALVTGADKSALRVSGFVVCEPRNVVGLRAARTHDEERMFRCRVDRRIEWLARE